MARSRMTGFARFLLALLVIVPLAFVAATYINGGDPAMQIRNLLGLEQAPGADPDAERLNVSPGNSPGPAAPPDENDARLRALETQVQAQQDSLRLLRQQLDEIRQALR